MQQQHAAVKALVIREVDFGDAERYITVLTEQGRKLEVLCRGARRKGARTAGAARLFCWSELILYEARGRYSLHDATLIVSFWEVTQCIEGYALACYFAELAAHVTIADEDSPAVTRLMLYALRALCGGRRPLPLIKAAFELRLFAEVGYRPRILACGACGGPLAGAMFSVAEGVAVCVPCARRLGGVWEPADAGTLAAMRHILESELPRVFSFALGGQGAQQLSGLCERYALYYAERDFDSLRFYHSLLLPPTLPQKRGP